MDERRKNEDDAQLRKVVAALEEEVSYLRRRVREAPGRVDELEADLNRAKERLDRAAGTLLSQAASRGRTAPLHRWRHRSITPLHAVPAEGTHW